MPLPEPLIRLLARRGIEQLYSHQVAALEMARDGQDFVVVTGTASGKTLCYNLPILETALADANARALYLFQGNKDTLFRIHGTNQPEYIGQAISSGCIRMLNEDYYRLFKLWRTTCRWLRFGGEVTWNDHERILDAIEHRDAECAEILMRRHIARLRIESFAELQRLGADPAGTA